MVTPGKIVSDAPSAMVILPDKILFSSQIMSFEITVSEDDTVNGTIEISSNTTIVEGTKAFCRILPPLLLTHIKPKASSLELSYGL